MRFMCQAYNVALQYVPKTAASLSTSTCKFLREALVAANLSNADAEVLMGTSTEGWLLALLSKLSSGVGNADFVWPMAASL